MQKVIVKTLLIIETIFFILIAVGSIYVHVHSPTSIFIDVAFFSLAMLIWLVSLIINIFVKDKNDKKYEKQVKISFAISIVIFIILALLLSVIGMAYH